MNETRQKQLFIIPSVAGILLFMVPIRVNGTWTILVKLLADGISMSIGGMLPLLCCIVLTVSAVMAVISLARPGFIMGNKLLRECFSCAPGWTVVRALGCVFAWLTFLGVGSEGGSGLATMISSADQGGVALELIAGLVIIFAIASFLCRSFWISGSSNLSERCLPNTCVRCSGYPAEQLSTA